MDKNQKEARRHQEDVALNRGLMWVGGAVVLECLLLLVNRYYINYFVSEVDLAILIRSVLNVVRVAGAVAGLAGLAWAVLQFRKGGKYGLPAAAGLTCLALAVCGHVAITFQKAGVQMLFVMVPAWAGLALVYYLYQREFFLAAVASGLSVLGLWFVRYADGVGPEAAAVLVGIVLVAVVTFWLKKRGGVVRLADGQEVRLLEKNTSYGAALVSCLIGAAVMLAAMVLGANIAYYLIFAMIAWLFALLVYYTVKMM